MKHFWDWFTPEDNPLEVLAVLFALALAALACGVAYALVSP